MLLFDSTTSGSLDALLSTVYEEDQGSKGRALRCAACGRVITHSGQRISVQGGHEHTRCNPHGFSYHFGCFARAPGCGHVGEPSADFSWFAGHSWRIAICGSCGEHLGWCFRREGNSGFYGLILARLVSDEN